jgi:hypothetical protein
MDTGVKIGVGGLPTDIDVQRLQEKFGVPKPGDFISYADITACLGNQRKEPRFWTVTNSWRAKLFKENNLVTKAVRDEGFEFLDSHKRVTHSVALFDSGLSKVDRASLVAARTDRTGLAPEEVRVCDHFQNLGAQLKLAAATAAQQLTYADPVKET